MMRSPLSRVHLCRVVSSLTRRCRVSRRWTLSIEAAVKPKRCARHRADPRRLPIYKSRVIIVEKSPTVDCRFMSVVSFLWLVMGFTVSYSNNPTTWVMFDFSLEAITSGMGSKPRRKSEWLIEFVVGDRLFRLFRLIRSLHQTQSLQRPVAQPRLVTYVDIRH